MKFHGLMRFHIVEHYLDFLDKVLDEMKTILTLLLLQWLQTMIGC